MGVSFHQCIQFNICIQSWKLASTGLHFSVNRELPSYDILNNYWMRSSRIWEIIKAEVCVSSRSRRLRQVTQTKALIIPHFLREPNSIIVLLFICICESFPWRRHLYFPAFGKKSINLCDVIRSYKYFQYTNKLCHNVVYVFSIFEEYIITPNLGNYWTDMTI